MSMTYVMTYRVRQRMNMADAMAYCVRQRMNMMDVMGILREAAHEYDGCNGHAA